jgi:hypothetical protein
VLESSAIDGDDDDSWTTLCELPCERHVDPDRIYRIGASGRRATQPFKVPEGGTSVVNATLGSKPLRIVGIVVTPAGGAAALGALTIARGGLGEQCLPSDHHCSSGQTGMYVLAGVGVAVALVGVVMLLRSSTTLSIDRASTALTDGVRF